VNGLSKRTLNQRDVFRHSFPRDHVAPVQVRSSGTCLVAFLALRPRWIFPRALFSTEHQHDSCIQLLLFQNFPLPVCGDTLTHRRGSPYALDTSCCARCCCCGACRYRGGRRRRRGGRRRRRRRRRRGCGFVQTMVLRADGESGLLGHSRCPSLHLRQLLLLPNSCAP